MNSHVGIKYTCLELEFRSVQFECCRQSFMVNWGEGLHFGLEFTVRSGLHVSSGAGVREGEGGKCHVHCQSSGMS